MKSRVAIIGAGLAGCEVAYQLASSNISVDLYEARLNSNYFDGVHKTTDFAELVCSNSFRSNLIHNASGMLKEELRLLGSLIINVADKTKIPAGGSLTVLRNDFSKEITKTIKEHININIISSEVEDLYQIEDKYDLVVMATGPLSSKNISISLQNIINDEFLYFYDAIAPIISFDSINLDYCFFANRYDLENSDYLNIPLNKEEYYDFVKELINGEKVPIHHGDENIFFEACMPVEVMASRGVETLRNGPMRGDGLLDPRTKKYPYAAVQFRKDNLNMYNMVGFQTRLKYGEQKRIFTKLKALENANFYRYGSMHRNTYVCAPKVLMDDMSLVNNNKIFIAGQLSGVEGYMESVAQGYMVSLFIKKRLALINNINIPNFSATYSLINYLRTSDANNFQPMKINYGIIPGLNKSESKLHKGKHKKRLAISQKSIDYLKNKKINNYNLNSTLC